MVPEIVSFFLALLFLGTPTASGIDDPGRRLLPTCKMPLPSEAQFSLKDNRYNTNNLQEGFCRLVKSEKTLSV